MIKTQESPIHQKVILGLILGAIAGLGCHHFSQYLPFLETFRQWVAVPIGQLFLRLIFVMVLPLMLSALITASAKLGMKHEVGAVAVKSITYALFLALMSGLLSVGIVNTLKPGLGLDQSLINQHIADQELKYTIAQDATTIWTQKIVNIIPSNPFEAIVDCLNPAKDGSIVAVILVSILVGLTLSRCDPKKVAPLTDFLEAILEMSRTYLGFVMRMAPIAVGALIFSNTLQFGFELIKILAGYVLAVLLGLSVQMLLVYGVTLRLKGGIGIWDFLKRSKLISMTAFSTSSSNATLPISIEVGSKEFKLDRDIGRFILTLGASANQNGSALYEGITVLFLAQLYHVDLSLHAQLTVIAMTMVASLGTAGVPGGTLPLMIGVLSTLNIPAEGLVLILGVERILDMSRTVVNSIGDMVIALCIDRSEKRKWQKKNLSRHTAKLD